MVRVQSRESSDDSGTASTRLWTLDSDHSFLLHAIRLGQRGLGRTWPNPSVGCVLVKTGAVLAAARTGDGGRPHAETQALAMAGDAARGATAYVSLEPCAHHGNTPPCAQALIAAGIARVVIGCEDPDPRVAGKGIAMLEAAGIEVTRITNHASRITNRGFIRRITQRMPYVAMKLATSADYFMARNDGGGQWITGPAARAHGHRIRGMHDAVLTGIGTVLADDPLLTVRAPNAPHPNLVRIVADRKLRLPLASQLVKTAEQFPLWVMTTPEGVEQAASHASDLREAGVKFLVTEDAQLSPQTLLTTLAAEGITRLLIEAGPELSSVFLTAGAVETLHWYRAPIALGNTGQAAIPALHTTLADAARVAHTAHVALGEDHCDTYELTPCSPD